MEVLTSEYIHLYSVRSYVVELADRLIHWSLASLMPVNVLIETPTVFFYEKML